MKKSKEQLTEFIEVEEFYREEMENDVNEDRKMALSIGWLLNTTKDMEELFEGKELKNDL